MKPVGQNLFSVTIMYPTEVTRRKNRISRYFCNERKKKILTFFLSECVSQHHTKANFSPSALEETEESQKDAHGSADCQTYG